jgi:hypothetical protein
VTRWRAMLVRHLAAKLDGQIAKTRPDAPGRARAQAEALPLPDTFAEGTQPGTSRAPAYLVRAEPVDRAAAAAIDPTRCTGCGAELARAVGGVLHTRLLPMGRSGWRVRCPRCDVTSVDLAKASGIGRVTNDPV